VTATVSCATRANMLLKLKMCGHSDNIQFPENGETPPNVTPDEHTVDGWADTIFPLKTRDHVMLNWSGVHLDSHC